MTTLFILSTIFIVTMFCMYLVNDYRNGVVYKGFIGKIQNLIKH